MSAAARNLVGKATALAFAGVATVSAVNQTLYNVDGGQRAVIFDRFTGVKETVSGEGTHFLVPWVQRPIYFSIRSTPRSVSTTTGTKDMQTVSVSLRILQRPDPAQLPKIYNNLGQDYEERVLPSITNEVLKSVVAQYDAAEMITQREAVSGAVCDDLRVRAAQFGIILDDIAITHLSFNAEFTAAVEAKQVAQQQAERARFLVEKEEHVRAATITTAEGDAEAAKLISEAYQASGNGLTELRRIEAAEENAVELARSKTTVYWPSDANLLISIAK